MTSKEERLRRRALVRHWQQQEQAALEAEADERLPFPRQQLVDLFRYIDDGWDQQGCDHTPRRPREYLNSIDLTGEQQDAVLAWLAEQGGACDCEILANVAELWVEGFDPGDWKFEGH